MYILYIVGYNNYNYTHIRESLTYAVCVCIRAFLSLPAVSMVQAPCALDTQYCLLSWIAPPTHSLETDRNYKLQRMKGTP